MADYLKFDSPIHNLQVFLRTISRKYSDIPAVIPDGIYGNDTKDAVTAFQKHFCMNQSGITDYSTWDTIVNVYNEILEEIEPGKCVSIYPENGLDPANENYSSTLLVIQSMIYAIAQNFDNIPRPSLNGEMDEKTIWSIKAVQRACGLNPDGVLTKTCWNYLATIYETFISKDRVSFANLG